MTNGGLRSVNTKWMRLLLIAVLALCMGTSPRAATMTSDELEL